MQLPPKMDLQLKHIIFLIELTNGLRDVWRNSINGAEHLNLSSTESRNTREIQTKKPKRWLVCYYDQTIAYAHQSP